MLSSPENNQSIFITGGTSGLGLELVRLFLMKGFKVIATGRKSIVFDGFEKEFFFHSLDFNDLNQVASETRKICSEHSISLVIDNAGILSPPEYIETADGFEYTFQINFLAHLLINEIIVNSIKDSRKIKIAAVTSPVYRFASLHQGIEKDFDGYRPMRSYSASKLYVAMMQDLLASRLREQDVTCFSFNPGTFSSGIYRMQKKWFRSLYAIAAPFMRDPGSVAKVLAELITDEETVSGMIYDISKNRRSIPEADESLMAAFTNSCYAMITPFLK